MHRVVGGVLAALSLVTVDLSAQGVYTGPEPFAATWTVSGGEGSYLLDLRFRNTAGFTPGSITGVFGIFIERVTPDLICGGNCGLLYYDIQTVGAVDQRTFRTPASDPLVNDFRYWGGFDPEVSGLNVLIGPTAFEMLPGPTSRTLGLLGCSVPVNRSREGVGPFSESYTGRTCAQSGYGGSLRALVEFTLESDYVLTHENFRITPWMYTEAIATVPAPATLGLLLIGLGGLALPAVRRARRI